MRRAVQKRSAYFVLLSLAAAGVLPAFGATKLKAVQAADAELHDRKYLEAEQTLVAGINREMSKGVDSVVMVPLLDKLCDAYRMERKYSDLEKLQLQLIELWRHAGAADQIMVARSMSDLAHTYLADGRLTDAEASWQSAIEILEREKRIIPTVLANYLRNLANVRSKLGRYDEAEADYKRALQILGDEDPQLQTSITRDHATSQERAKNGADPTKAETDAREIKSGVKYPKPVFERKPYFTARAFQVPVQGTVVLQLVVDQTGRPTQIAVLEPLGSGLDQNALKAASEWRFEPATKDGQPISIPITIEMSFYRQ